MAQNLEIDLRDPRVQSLLGQDEGGIVAPDAANGKRTLMHLAGDEEEGLQSKLNLDTGKSLVAVWYPRHELLLELDVFLVPGAPPTVHAICPRCRHHLTISGLRKKIAWDPHAENPMRREIASRLPPHHQARALRGKISIEPFECTWELNTDQAVSSDSTIGKGNLCRWRGAIDDNVVKEV